MGSFSDWDNPFLLFKFSENDKLQVPLYTEVVDRTWNPPDLDQIVSYLHQCPVITAIPIINPIVCPICGKNLEVATSCQRSDGIWIWLSSLPHYVQFHNVRLPDKMVERIRSNHYRPPA